MQRYRYVKVAPVTITLSLLPFFSITVGIAMLFWVLWPIVSQIIYTTAYGYVISPLSQDFIERVEAEEVTRLTDLTKASNWFPKNATSKMISSVNTYTLSIPKLGIVKATVKIGSDDLSKNLIHYGDTGLPGKYGNAVVFGHSILPRFYNPKNYLAIFSLLPTLKEGDDIFAHFDGVDYRYEVIGVRITDPDDVSGLEQKYDESYITLVTCFPAGTYLQRLWLTARQKPFGSD